jgi:hypothetical protein
MGLSRTRRSPGRAQSPAKHPTHAAKTPLGRCPEVPIELRKGCGHLFKINDINVFDDELLSTATLSQQRLVRRDRADE